MPEGWDEGEELRIEAALVIRPLTRLVDQRSASVPLTTLSHKGRGTKDWAACAAA